MLLVWSQDGLLIGASSVEQLEANLHACEAARGSQGTRPTPLPPSVLAALDGAWGGAGADAAALREGAFPYWRSYSKDMPGREALPQGASYDAAKKK
jgi:aflatoxin B1 aldehyde reductase